MSIWSQIGLQSRLSQLLWREAEPSPAAPLPAAAREATGAPEILRKAVRFLLIAFVATTLTAQTAGIHLTTPVDADEGYRQCIQNCNQDFNECTKECKGKSGSALTNCKNQCATKRDKCLAKCRREGGDMGGDNGGDNGGDAGDLGGD